MARPFPPPNRLPPPDDALWIGSAHPFDLHEVYLNFRAPLWRWDGSGEVKLFITADSRYRLWVNGRFVNRGPARSYPHAQKADELNLTNYLSPGDNQLAVQLYQPGYSHFSAVHRGAAGLLAWLVQDEEVMLVSNGRWRVQRDGSFASNVPRVSIYGSGVEQRDWRKVECWQTADFEDDDWSAARVVAAAEGVIWSGLQKRSVPLLTERDAPLKLVEYRQGPSVTADEVHERLRHGWQAAASHPAPPNDTGWFHVSLKNDQAHYWLFDLGRAYTCQGWAEIEAAHGGGQLAISYADKMKAGELVLSDPSTYCRMRLTDCFRLRPGTQTVIPFHMRGGRYVLFQLIGGAAESEVRLRPQVRIAEYPLTVTKPLQTGDELLDNVVAVCENTLRSCLQETFVDCVWRESSQWLGDALPQGLALLAMGDDARPLRTVLLDTAQGIYPDGILPSVAPAEVHAYTIPRYNCMWVELLAHYFAYSQDQEFVQYLWPTLKQVLAALLAHRDEAGLLVHPAGRRFYIDWSPTVQSDPHLVYNLHVVLALQTAADLAQRFEPEMVSVWQEQAVHLKQLCREAYWHHGRWWDDLEQTSYSQLGGAMALLTEAVQPDEMVPLLDEMIGRSLDARDDHVVGEMVLASPFMHHYLFEALRKYGRETAVVDIIKHRWGRWVNQGYPTTWENWNVDFPDGSQCHAFSAHPRYHLDQIFEER